MLQCDQVSCECRAHARDGAGIFVRTTGGADGRDLGLLLHIPSSSLQLQHMPPTQGLVLDEVEPSQPNFCIRWSLILLLFSPPHIERALATNYTLASPSISRLVFQLLHVGKVSRTRFMPAEMPGANVHLGLGLPTWLEVAGGLQSKRNSKKQGDIQRHIV